MFSRPHLKFFLLCDRNYAVHLYTHMRAKSTLLFPSMDATPDTAAVDGWNANCACGVANGAWYINYLGAKIVVH